MGPGPLTSVLRHLHRLLGAPRGDAPGDAQLLQRFARGNDQGAFTALVRRHGPLVWGACRRVLGHEHDAEDAFQATFLVLAKKAGAIRRPEALGAWLYGVACHIALKARAAAARRRQREREAGTMPRPEGSDERLRQELRQVLDEELHRLPQRYRRLLVLCDLQGRTHQEAARELTLPPGSVSRHLGRGRELLRERLVRRGITLSAALLAACLAGEAAAAAPAALLAPTVQAAVAFVAGGAVPAQAAALAKGALRTMLLTKVKITALALLTGLALAGAGYAAHRVLNPAPARPGPEAKLPPPADDGPPPARTDRQGDPLPADALARLGAVRFRLDGSVQAVVFTPDGRQLVANGGGMGPTAWEAATGRALKQFHARGGERARCMALSRDGRTLAVGDGTGAIDLIDFAAGQPVRRLTGPKEAVTALAFSPDGKVLASGREFDVPRRQGQDNPIQLWDVAAGKELRPLIGHKDTVLSMAFSPDGKTLASGAERYDATLRLWDVDTGRELFALKGHDGELWSVAFSPNGKTVATGSMDKTIRLWDPATGKEKGRLTGHEADVMAVAFSPDSKTLASGSFDRTLRLWDPAAGKQRWRVEVDEAGDTSTLASSSAFRPGRGFPALAFSPNGKTLAAGGRDHTLRLFDAAFGSEIRPIKGQFDAVDAVAFSPDGDRVWTVGGDRNLRLWEAATGKEVSSLETSAGLPLCVAFSADGKRAATGGGEQDKTAHIWDLATGKELQHLATPDVIGALAFSPDGRTLATANRWQRAEVRLWDVGAGKLLRQLPAPGEQGNNVVSLAFTPDGRTLVGAGYDGVVTFWDPATGAESLPRLKHFEHCQLAALSPDGRTLAVGNMNGTVCLYETATGRERCRCQGYPFCFSPDGRLLAAGRDGEVAVWGLAEGKELGRLAGHNGDIRALAFSADGARLASGSEDTTALVWELEDLRQPAPPRAELPAEKLERLWNDLANEDASAAYRAQWALVMAPQQAASFLAEKVRPAPPADERQTARLLADLDNDDFAVRERAEGELRTIGESAEPALRRAAAGDLTPEARRRVGALLERLRELSPERLRALEALERIGSPEARTVVERLAREAPETRLGKAAKDALRRMDRAGSSAGRGTSPR